MQAMILTVIGKDKVGLVNEIAQCIKDAQGNWLKSSFCHLAGQFAGFVQVMLPQSKHQQLITACNNISNLHITLTPVALNTDENDSLLSTKNNTGNAALVETQIKVTGNDRQGIVSDITSTLNTFNINIMTLNTTCESAPNWGNSLFIANLSIQCQPDVEPSQLKESIEALADDLIVEFE